ncbi:glycoside hydrolase family 2 TIM barrel-domain containing protein [uncultured Maribacter sp.]|uniref:glycoside hydrolase family 2 TIM barrel-domain containing protein n=1 Tax=uncultured Maribacter sp. TaxID=431308 RepID=UPI00262FBB5E|nr:glycoside hydrolase family 2 TIM barrel-domain containing protein [uncultured Maribacter sp.]
MISTFKKQLSLLLLVVVASCSTQENKIAPSNSKDFNFGWEFKLENFNDSKWKSVKVPHDWSVEHSFDSINGEGATGYLPGGIGLYRKRFSLDLKENQVAYVLFDGVYNNSDVVLNGNKLGFHPYGYSPFFYDITSSLKDGKENLIEVKVDRSRFVDSRWYTGSGIYRDVKLITKNKLHIPIWGTFLTTPKVSENEATINIDVTVNNKYKEDNAFKLVTQLYNNKNEKVGEKSDALSLIKNSQDVFKQEIIIKSPSLWGVDNPVLYKAITTVTKEGEIVDVNETTFGIRSIVFDTDKGFFLNGENMKIKGVCLHHDGGLVGSAVPKGVWRRRFEKLKEGGCNAIRVSHNPASEEFLELCDEMGILVQDEFFDEWDNPKDKRLNKWETKVDSVTQGYGQHFQKWAKKDLTNTMLAHRNHPSIIQWSIGNEIEWTYPNSSKATGFFGNMEWTGNYFWEKSPYSIEQVKEKVRTLPKGKYDIGETAKKLAKWTKELDTTRYVIANCILPTASYETGYADALDIIGFSYRRVLYDYGHENYPELPLMGTENLGQWHEWKAIEERPHVSGTFLWTGIDYMGESHGRWPRKTLNSGLLDQAGFEKPSFYMYKTLWSNEPSIYIATQQIDKSINKIDKKTGEIVAKDPEAWKTALWIWHNVNNHWNYAKDEMVSVEVYSNSKEVELFLNDTSLGVKKLADFDDHIYKWAVPFNAGKLTAKGKLNGKEFSTTLTTSESPSEIKLTVDKKELNADGYDVAHIVAQLVDKNGNPVKTENAKITFSSEGDVAFLGVDNGSATNVQDYQSNSIITDKGRCMLIVQATTKASEITVSAVSENLKSNTINIISNNQ